MKNTGKQIRVTETSLYDVYRTIWEDKDNRYWIKYNGELIEVFKHNDRFCYKWELGLKENNNK